MSDIKNQGSVESQTLKRGMRSRQVSMIAIGGAIGTGLFLASGNAIAVAGPGGALVAYLLVGLMVFFLMTSLGEMAAYMPVTGTFNTYAAHFVDPAFGFAMGLNYWYNWAITIAAELVAAGLIMKFWLPETSILLWSMLFLCLMVGLNLLSVRGYGESEYWLSIVKVVTVIVFIVVGLLVIFGILGGQSPPGFENWTIGEAPFVGGGWTILSIFLVAGFAFQGTELIGVAAGETENPRQNIPKAVKKVFWRILIFYILATFVISLIIPYTDTSLVSADIENIALSPFTIVFERAGLAIGASVMNAVILTAILSAGNSGMYASTRTLWHLAKIKQAPKIFAKVNRRGVPVYALMATAAVGMLAFLASLFGDGTVYIWLLHASGLSGFIAWVGIAISHYRFRRAFIAQGYDLSELPYRSKLFPFGPLFALGVCLVVIAGQNYQAFTQGQIDWYGISISYLGIPIFFILWLGYKLIHKTKLIPLKECRFKELTREDAQSNE